LQAEPARIEKTIRMQCGQGLPRGSWLNQYIIAGLVAVIDVFVLQGISQHLPRAAGEMKPVQRCPTPCSHRLRIRINRTPRFMQPVGGRTRGGPLHRSAACSTC
jgi:hypothetical protein